jgi:hypothetical protein
MDYTLTDAVLILLNGILHLANRSLMRVPDEMKLETKKQMYDMLNLRFSGVLETFAPEFELRPNLTEAAILKAENEILQDEMSKMQK